MRKFKNESTGYIAISTMANDKYKLESMPQYTLPKEIVEKSKDWVEIFEPKFKNGDVVKCINATIILITDFDKCEGFGINKLGEWIESKGLSFKTSPEYWQLATEEEWLEALTKEAVKRGFKEGVTIDRSKLNNLCWNYNLKLNKNFNEKFIWNPEFKTLTFYGKFIMEDGVWADVVKEETLEELAERFEKYFYENNMKHSCDFKNFFNENKETINRLSK